MANLKKINVNNQTYDLGITEVASTDAKGLMSAPDKTKLDGLKSGDEYNTELTTIKGNVASVTETADAADALSKSNAATIATHTTNIANNKTAVEAAQAQADKGVADAATAKAAADAAQTDVDAVEGRMDTAESNITAHSSKLTELEGKLAGVNGAVDSSTFNDLKGRVDAIEAGQNLADMVETKADLDAMATTNLLSGDKIQVLKDEAHGGASTVYNYNGSAFEYIGEYGQNSYSKTEIDNKLTEVESHANKVDFAVADETLTITVKAHAAAETPQA